MSAPLPEPSAQPYTAPSPWEQRQALLDITDLASSELTRLLTRLRDDAVPTQVVVDALMELLPQLGDQYGSAAAYLAAEWFDEARLAAEARGTYMAEQAGDVGRARWQALARWGTDPLRLTDPDWAAAMQLIMGGLQRTIADRHRLTITDNSYRDPQARGWQRVGTGDTCKFCRFLIDRGGVYTDRTVTFRSHDSCRCAASPTWDPRIRVVSREAFVQSARHRTPEQKAAHNARLRKALEAVG